MKPVIDSQETRRVECYRQAVQIVKDAEKWMGSVFPRNRLKIPKSYIKSKAIVALGPDATIEQYTNVAKKESEGCGPIPTRQTICDGCDSMVDTVVQVGEKPDYESHTAWLCKSCLLEALALFASNEPERPEDKP